MLIVVMMDMSSNDIACWVVPDILLYCELDNMVISDEDVCCSVVYDTLVDVTVFSDMVWVADDTCY